jgi:hypothetical protein
MARIASASRLARAVQKQHHLALRPRRLPVEGPEARVQAAVDPLGAHGEQFSRLALMALRTENRSHITRFLQEIASFLHSRKACFADLVCGDDE